MKKWWKVGLNSPANGAIETQEPWEGTREGKWRRVQGGEEEGLQRYQTGQMSVHIIEGLATTTTMADIYGELALVPGTE